MGARGIVRRFVDKQNNTTAPTAGR